MKYNHIIWVLFALVALVYGGYSAYAFINRVPSLEEMQADRNQKNQEVRDRCHLDSQLFATGSTEREKIISSRKWEDQCLQDYLLDDLNTNPWKYTGGIAPVPERQGTNSSIYPSINSSYEHNKSTLWHASEEVSANWDKVLKTLKTEGVWMDSTHTNWQQVLMTPLIPTTWDNSKKGTDTKIRSTESILGVLGLDTCRIVQDEDSHVTLKRGHVYATDIACERWQSFTVSAPQWKKSYTVKAVWYEKRIGNYIVLESKNYMFVFWHTNSPQKVGDIIPAWTQIWYSDKSGVAENIHLHFELWRDGYNITSDEMLWKWSRWNDEYSFKLLTQRSWYTGVNDAINFIASFEWFQDTSYEDPKGSWRWSIGFWTIASGPWEKITREVAKKRIYTKVFQNMEFIYKNRLALSWNERIAISSFFYNLWTWRPEFISAMKTRDFWKMKASWMQYVSPGSIYEDWLTKRRAKEWSKFISK